MDILLKIACQYTPRQLLSLVEEFYNFRLYYKIKINSLFPNTKVIKSAKLTDVLIFSLSNKITFNRSCLKNNIIEMSIIQKMLLRDLLLFENLLSLQDRNLTVDYKDLLYKNLGSVAFYRVTILYCANFKQFGKMLIDFLASIVPV